MNFSKETLREFISDADLENQISITSKTGCGKSTLIARLQARLATYDFKFVSAGSVMRAFAKEKGMSVEDFAKHIKDHPEECWDERIDKEISNLRDCDKHIFEGRLVHIFLPRAFKVRLVCPPEICAERRSKEKGIPYEKVLRDILERDANDARYDTVYPGWNWPDADFDLVISTVDFSPERACARILDYHRTHRSRFGARNSSWRERVVPDPLVLS